MLIGGSGRLGRHLQKLLPHLIAPPREQVDLLQPETLQQALQLHSPSLVINASGYTDVARAESDQAACWNLNVICVSHLVKALRARPCGLLHFSTDYVFDGQRGNYHEHDIPGLPCNYYGLSKLVGEQVAATWEQTVVVRTSFREWPWPHPVAFQDLFTSQDYLHLIAPEFALLVTGWGRFPDKILHIASERKSALELARRSRPEVGPAWRKDARVAMPADVSLDTTRWSQLRNDLLHQAETEGRPTGPS